MTRDFRDDPWDRLDALLDTRAAPLTFWWRDDDAGDDHPSLARLLDLAAAHGAPVALAVIPARATDALARRLETAPRAAVLQHGWDHADHAPPGAKAIELGGDRSHDAVARDLARGRTLLDAAFGSRFVPALAPPWNRMAAEVVALLPGLGFRGLSCFAGPARDLQTGLRRVDAHLDPVAWHRGRGFVGERAALAPLTEALAADSLLPFGLLTHHLVMDDATWAFVGKLIARLTARRTVRAPPPAALFAGGRAEGPAGDDRPMGAT